MNKSELIAIFHTGVLTLTDYNPTLHQLTYNCYTIHGVKINASSKFSAACSELPVSWNDVETEIEFPVAMGTRIPVSCPKGYINLGSKVITCNTGSHPHPYNYDKRPECVRDPRKFRSLKIALRTHLYRLSSVGNDLKR